MRRCSDHGTSWLPDQTDGTQNTTPNRTETCGSSWPLYLYIYIYSGVLYMPEFMTKLKQVEQEMRQVRGAQKRAIVHFIFG